MTVPNRNPRVARPTFGEGLLRGLPARLMERPAVLTQPEPWELVKTGLASAGDRVHLVTTMEHSRVREVCARFDGASAIFGIGGGSALDRKSVV